MANSSDVRLLLQAGAALMQKHPEEYWKWSQYAAGAELLNAHIRGTLSLSALPSSKHMVEDILGHPIDQPPPTEIGEVRDRVQRIVGL